MKTTEKYQQTRWSLADLYPSSGSQELQDAFSKLEERVSQFEAVRPKLVESLSNSDFLEILRQLETITYEGQRVYSFAQLFFTEDTQNQTALGLLAKVQQIFADLSNLTLFFSIWWKDLPDDTANRLMADTGDYRYWLEEMRHFKPHTLTEAEEKIINIKDVTGSSALNTLYDSITNRYTFKLEIDGEMRQLTRGELMVHARSSDGDLRARVYQELYRVYEQDGPILGQIYQTLVRDWRNEQVSLRKFASPISARNLGNDISDSVVDVLLGVCKQNTEVFQRYFKMKARWLKQPRLRRYDIYAPVTSQNKNLFSFDEAARMVFDSFAQFDPLFCEMAERVFAENHLDSEVRQGKQSGAFCATAMHDRTPWVLLNFQGKVDDVSTMAHELGHAVHAMLAAHHSAFTAHASLPMAETASTFAEMILVDRMLANEPDESARRDLLFRQVDDAYATIQRQAFFAIFESQAHEMIANGASVDELADMYQKALTDQFGDAVEVSAEFRWEWVSIPHIYAYPFYVYAYSFGQLLAMALYQQYKVEGNSFVLRYLKILSTGGSMAPVQVLAEAGIDVTQASFWQGGYNVIRQWMDQLEKMPVE
jgi:oligoendopeptidase F